MAETHTRYIAKPKLKELLKSKKIKEKIGSQKELARLVGVKEPTISRFDNQTRYDINTLVSISKELGVSIEDLFTIEENPNYIQLDIPDLTDDNMKEVANFLSSMLERDIIKPTFYQDGQPKSVSFSEYVSDEEKKKLSNLVIALSDRIDKLK
ncbi:helix-turn-helix transcriptional regulator [Bacillus sp. AG4(2022)]|uniref:helix-turn-helix domain-containing protein n=1 Tax=Bacillus sp. AG4(2022) TaxID=2962594 RepID=UPI0028828F0A|nr:helix-turn-helix transcriptional regulator [Bacillus sp. AG4(2022)]MDT0160266.1 helix-turn-helix transcriptional regulator [Bacillus sp. AG4(2022)]